MNSIRKILPSRQPESSSEEPATKEEFDKQNESKNFTEVANQMRERLPALQAQGKDEDADVQQACQT